MKAPPARRKEFALRKVRIEKFGRMPSPKSIARRAMRPAVLVEA